MMAEYFVITLVFLLVFMVAMGVGFLVRGKELKGSCGGLGKIMGEDCNFCDKKSECDAQDSDHDCDSPIKIDAGRAYLAQ